MPAFCLPLAAFALPLAFGSALTFAPLPVFSPALLADSEDASDADDAGSCSGEKGTVMLCRIEASIALAWLSSGVSRSAAIESLSSASCMSESPSASAAACCDCCDCDAARLFAEDDSADSVGEPTERCGGEPTDSEVDAAAPEFALTRAGEVLVDTSASISALKSCDSAAACAERDGDSDTGAEAEVAGTAGELSRSRFAGGPSKADEVSGL